ncbi:hypothetical protein RNZ50_05075 [Paracoccaceae bacterium Fryx2]|nr:hypothetical protein [Paracoccaceae bacterium Fryx2]
MNRLTPEGTRIVSDIARRNGVSDEAVRTVLVALSGGQGRQAQFSHPELGGMGQWSSGGMVMIGDMFNNQLKARVDAICTELASAMADADLFAAAAGRPEDESGRAGGEPSGKADADRLAWPTDLGSPSSTGSQNDMRYAVFPDSRRLAVEKAGRLDVYDTGEHRISGVSQQQGSDQSLTFVSQNGLVRVADLRKVS